MGRRGTNLVRRSGIYYFRSRVPKSYQASFGKKEVVLSLNTFDYDTARIRATAVRLRMLMAFTGGNMADDKDNKTDEAVVFFPTKDENGNHKWWGGAPELGLSNEQAIEASARPIARPTPPTAPQPQPVVPQDDLHPDGVKSFTAFTQAYIANRGEGDQSNHRTAFKEMREVIGDKPIKDITKNDIIAVVDYMKTRPGRKGKKYSSYKTIDKKLTCMRGFFDSMKNNRNLIAQNPVDGITSEASKHEREEGRDNKRPFNKPELRKIFNAPLFTGCKSLTRVYDKGDLLCRNHKFWLPVTGFYTGARIAELMQLENSDIVKKDGYWFFHISRTSKFGHTKSTKNLPSIRHVPLHPDLIKLGFMGYLDRRKHQANDGLLFPRYDYGKMFNEVLLRRKLGLTDYEITFHSLRHNFKDACVEAELPDSMISRLMGHERATMTSQYGSKELFGKQAEAMAKLKFLITMAHLGDGD